MASVCGTDSAASQKLKRKSYSREFKLKVVTFYPENNLYQTSKIFSLNTKTILRWARDEKIEKAKKGSKHVQHHRRATRSASGNQQMLPRSQLTTSKLLSRDFTETSAKLQVKGSKLGHWDSFNHTR